MLTSIIQHVKPLNLGVGATIGTIGFALPDSTSAPIFEIDPLFYIYIRKTKRSQEERLWKERNFQNLAFMRVIWPKQSHYDQTRVIMA